MHQPEYSPDAIREEIRRNVSGARGHLQYSQTAVAERMVNLGFDDWRQQTVANVEKGKRRLAAEELLALARVLETTVSALLSRCAGHA